MRGREFPPVPDSYCFKLHPLALGSCATTSAWGTATTGTATTWTTRTVSNRLVFESIGKHLSADTLVILFTWYDNLHDRAPPFPKISLLFWDRRCQRAKFVPPLANWLSLNYITEYQNVNDVSVLILFPSQDSGWCHKFCTSLVQN